MCFELHVRLSYSNESGRCNAIAWPAIAIGDVPTLLDKLSSTTFRDVGMKPKWLTV